MDNIICIKWGTPYSADDVNKLYGMAARNRNRPFRFACFTDDGAGIRPEVAVFPIPPLNVPQKWDFQGWRKLALFAPELGDLEGAALFLDLDVLITGPLDDFFDLPGEVYIIENWTQPGQGVGNSSAFRFVIGAHTGIYDRFNAEPDAIIANYANEQTVISRLVGRDRLKFWPADWVVSFKRHCLPFYPLRLFQRPFLPKGARIVAFHGLPKIADAIRGEWRGRPLKLLKPAPWIAPIWRA
ncbi:MAG: hypothetical protein ACREFD_03595 [Stellaceae bacterium]